MKFSALILSLLLSFQLFAASVTLISDFDDTIKRSNVPNIWPQGVGNALLWRKVYTGMPELLQGLESEINGFYVLSASPKIIKPFILALLDGYDIAYDDVFTRNYLATEDKVAFKIEKIESVLNQNIDTMILMGDDVEADHEVYLEVAARNPGRIEEIYIHNVVNRELPDNVTSYFTPYDIAVSEYKKNRLTYDQVETVANTIIQSRNSKMYRVIPNYAYCPKKITEFNYKVPAELLLLTGAVNMKIIGHCLTRK